jgi:hypothetical protein
MGWETAMKQQTLAGFEKYGKTTRRAQFLAEMEQVVPWAQLCALIEPACPKGGSGEGGRRPVPLERMPRIHLLQLWFNLSDPAVEEALYDSAAMRSFARVEHAFWIIKGLSGFKKVRYRRLTKNLHRVQVACALAKLFMVRRRLLAG